MKTVFVCSPLRPVGSNTVHDNIALAERLCVAVLKAGFAPFAPHAFYTHFLDDASAHERELGMKAGRAFLLRCDEVWVYTKLGISDGMRAEIEMAEETGTVVVRDPPEWNRVWPQEGD